MPARHDTHGKFVCDALRHQKNIFVEKPLCITFQELDEITKQYDEYSARLMVGFNRRFAPHIKKIKSLLAPVQEPKSFIMTVNAGEIPLNHWTQDKVTGGGRILGEVCHFIDLLRFLADAKITSFRATSLDNLTICEDKVTITLTFEDGSFGVIHYLANGHKSFPKERLEIFTAGKILQLNNFRKLQGYGWPKFRKLNLWRQDKGQACCIQQFIAALENGGMAPIPIEEIIEVSKLSIEITNTLYS